MKYYKRLGLYKASNVTFNSYTLEAYSYDWWKFVAKVDGYVVFNDYYYSPTTLRHQAKVRRLLEELGVNIDILVHIKEGLQHPDFKRLIVEGAYYRNRVHAAESMQEIFKVKVPQSRIAEIYQEKEEQLCNAYLMRALKYQYKKILKIPIGIVQKKHLMLLHG